MSEQTFGRVDDAGNVYVTDNGVERLVGAYPDAPAEEAMAYFSRKFDDIVTSVSLVERRLATGASHNAKELRGSVNAARSLVDAGVGVGDFEAIRVRIAKLDERIAALEVENSAEHEAAKEQSLQARTAVVEKIEALASRDLTKVNWKETSANVDELFTQWQAEQKSGARVNKEAADALWKRFRNARATLDRARRAHFATVDSATKNVKSIKEALIARASDLITVEPEKALTAYRALLEEWKASPRASKKIDDALWAKFKAAGDAIYEAKKSAESAEDESFAGNLEVKKQLLAEGQPILTMTDREAARQLLTSIQKRWAEAGKVPRNSIKDVENGLRKLEAAVKKLDDDAWAASDPEKIARQEGLAGALIAKIAKLESELAAATSAKDSSRISSLTEAIETQKSWLATVAR